MTPSTFTAQELRAQATSHDERAVRAREVGMEHAPDMHERTARMLRFAADFIERIERDRAHAVNALSREEMSDGR